MECVNSVMERNKPFWRLLERAMEWDRNVTRRVD